MVWFWHMVVEITVATADSVDSCCDIGGQSTSIVGDLPAVRDPAISWNPGGSTFVWLSGLPSLVVLALRGL